MKNTNILFFIPNLIGYLRLILILASILLFNFYPYFVFYILIVANLLDLADGYSAKKLHQVSDLGSVLDYTIDRISTIVIITLVATLYPSYVSVFLLILCVDIASHFARIYTALYQGKKYHKDIPSRYKIVALYYAPSRIIMLISVVSYEFIFGILWVCHFKNLPLWFPLLLFILTFPGFIYKNIVHVLQLIECFGVLAYKHHDI